MSPVSHRRLVVMIVAGFLVFSYAWIFATATIVEPIAEVTGLPTVAVEVGKGLVFVTLAALLLAVSLNWYARTLQSSEQRWLQLAENTREGIFVVRLGEVSEFVFINAALARMTGYPESAFRADPRLPFRIVRADDHPKLRQIYAAPLEQQWPVRFGIVRADGELRWVRLSASVIRTASQEAVLQGLVVDVSEDQAREDALQDAVAAQRSATAQLQATDRAKQAFLTAVSHELRTPLTVVAGMAETLLRHGSRLTEDERAKAETALTEHSKRLRRTLDELLDIDRLERGAMPFAPTTVDLAQIVRDTVAASPVAERTHVTAPSQLTARADPVQIERILTNILDNAHRYAPDAAIEVRLTAPQDCWRLQVSDHGPGVPEDECARIFEPFYRLDERHPTPGTGVGLALVAEFAAIHGGTAHASVDDGLTITVEAPRDGPQLPDTPVDAAA